MSQPEPPVPDDLRGPRGYRGRQGKEGPEGPAQDDALLEELKKVGSDLSFRAQMRKLNKRVLIIAGVSLFFSLVAIVAAVGVRWVQVEGCKRDNRFRAAYVNQWNGILLESPEPEEPPEDAPQELKDAYQRQIRTRTIFENGLETDFAQQEC